MKLRIQKTAFIGDPEIGGEVEIKTNVKFTILKSLKNKCIFKAWILE